MANVKVRLKDATNNILHPETDWSVVQNKPSIFTYPGGAGTCIGDISGFRIFYLNSKFYVCVTADIAKGDYTLGFATPGGRLTSTTEYIGPITAFFVNIENLKIESTGVVDDVYKRLNLVSGVITGGNSLGFLGERDTPLLDSIAQGGQTTVSLTVNDTINNIILPADNGGALCIGMFTTQNIVYDDKPYLMMVTKLA